MPAKLVGVIRASLNAVRVAVAAQLALRTAIPAAHIRQIARHQRSIPHLDGDQDILLRWRGFRADSQQHRDRHDCRIVRRLSVVLRTRFELDEVGGDEQWLGDTTGGIIVREEDILDALQGFSPANAEGNLLTFEPLYVLEGDDYDMDKSEEWGAVELLFGVAIELSLEQREPV